MIESTLLPKLLNHLPQKEHAILIGARQTGKITLMRKVTSFLKKRREKAVFISFEDLYVLQKINEHPENLFQLVAKPQEGERVYVLIDEIQSFIFPHHAHQ